MNDIEFQTFNQVREALDKVEEAREDTSLTGPERYTLEQASVHLRNIERSIITHKEKEVATTLIADSNGLYDLSKQIKLSAHRLTEVADMIEKTTKVVALFTKALNTGLSSGLI